MGIQGAVQLALVLAIQRVEARHSVAHHGERCHGRRRRFVVPAVGHRVAYAARSCSVCSMVVSAYAACRCPARRPSAQASQHGGWVLSLCPTLMVVVASRAVLDLSVGGLAVASSGAGLHIGTPVLDWRPPSLCREVFAAARWVVMVVMVLLTVMAMTVVVVVLLLPMLEELPCEMLLEPAYPAESDFAQHHQIERHSPQL
mmetsp:Transcript_38584/g.96901  ORF Transcript_38584/g.96901 Transcript_38584/m.96901 type:complete len:201 (-) Transcript_38584:2305-2907(-)